MVHASHIACLLEPGFVPQASAITWFVVQKRGSELVPFTVRLHCPPPAPKLPNPDLEACLQELIEITAADPDRVDFNEVCLLIAQETFDLTQAPASFPCSVRMGHSLSSMHGLCPTERR